MSFEPRLRQDLIPQELKTPRDTIIIETETQYNDIIRNSVYFEKSKTPRSAKDIVETMDLIKAAIEDHEERTRKTEDAKVNITYENPDTEAELEAISISLTSRQPGSFSRGAPGEGDVKNRRPILREEVEDPDNPGYKLAILGYFHDNIITLTCWARTNKAANDRALWLEDLMEDYSWFFKYSGVNRLIYERRGPEIEKLIANNKIYGRPILYYVRTERIRTFSQKKLEQIRIKFSLTSKL